MLAKKDALNSISSTMRSPEGLVSVPVHQPHGQKVPLLRMRRTVINNKYRRISLVEAVAGKRLVQILRQRVRDFLALTCKLQIL